MKIYIFAIMDKNKLIVQRAVNSHSQAISFIKICKDNGYLGRWEEYFYEFDLKTGEVQKLDVVLEVA